MGTPLVVDTGASVEINQLLMDRRINSQSRGDVVTGPENISTERTGQWVLYLTNQSVIKVCDYRNGQQVSQKPLPLGARGCCWNREADRYIVGQIISGVWWAIEYSYPEHVQTRSWNLGDKGVTSLNALRYTVNNRFLLVAHSTGSLVIVASTGATQVIDAPLTGDVKQFECLSSMYAMAMRSNTGLKLCQINTGRDMPALDPFTWDELATFTWNWEVDEVTPYPHFLLAGRKGSTWSVVPYKMGNFDYYESKQFEVILTEKPLAIAYSEAYTSNGVITESRYGRAFAVFFPNRYEIYNVLTGEKLATLTTPNQTVAAGWWKEAQGLYL